MSFQVFGDPHSPRSPLYTDTRNGAQLQRIDQSAQYENIIRNGGKTLPWKLNNRLPI